MKRFLIPLLACLAAFPAHAQYSSRDVDDRMNKLERDLMTIQRQVARGEPVSGGTSAVDGGGNTEVRLSAMEEELRRLRGRVEENEFEAKRNGEALTKLQRDVDFRLNALEQKGAPAATDAEAARQTPKGNLPEAKDGIDPKPDADQQFESSREHYNYAFRLLNQTRYEDAATSFKSFIAKYPKDQLIGNAYYWLGETHYIRRDYVKAADNFRQGFEAMPNGAKAADNLLKLAMSLSAMKNTKDACTVLTQVGVKFKDSSPAVAQKAETERGRIGCK